MSADKPKHGTTSTEHHQTDVTEPTTPTPEGVEVSAPTDTPKNTEGAGPAAARVMGSGASTHPTGH